MSTSQAKDAEATVLDAIRMLLGRRDHASPEVTLASDMHEDLDFESLELAELSVLLEDNLGHDPYSEGIVPRTVGELVAYYGSS